MTSVTGLRSSPFDLKRLDDKLQPIFLAANKKMANFHRPWWISATSLGSRIMGSCPVLL